MTWRAISARPSEEEEEEGQALSHDRMTTVVATWVLDPTLHQGVTAEIESIAALEMK